MATPNNNLSKYDFNFDLNLLQGKDNQTLYDNTFDNFKL